MRTLLALLLAASVASTNPKPITISVYPRISSAPATLRVRVTRSEDEQERALDRAVCVQVDGPEFRSSCREISPPAAPRTAESWVKDLPAGCYVATVTLVRVGGVTKSVSEGFQVVGFGEETEGC